MKKGRGILLSQSNDLAISVRKKNGLIIAGIMLGYTVKQNQAMILYCQPGELKNVPTVGVGISNILLDNDNLAWRLSIRRQLENDGQIVKRLIIDSKFNLEIHAEYR